MEAVPARSSRISPSDWLLLALIMSLPLMKPSVSYPIVLPDLIFVALAVSVGFEVAVGRRRVQWPRPGWILLLYVLSFAPSLLATSDLGASAFKLSTQMYLIALALLTAMLVDSPDRLRRAILAWLVATAIPIILAVFALAAFLIAPEHWVVDYARFHFGTLPPGKYPRFSLTFLDANMACNYLTVSAGLLLAAHASGWLARPVLVALLAGTAVAALTTISAGLGGLALTSGVWLWLTQRRRARILARLALAGGVAAAAAFLVALAVTPVIHPTAPFLIRVPGTDLMLAPSARLMLWSGAWTEFTRNPLVGHGIGIDATYVRYLDPSGNLQLQTDAHNSFLNIAAQCGIVGLAGLALLIAYALRLARPWQVDSAASAARVALGLSFLVGFAYQGLGVSFEDTRHLWVGLGLLIAAAQLSRSGGNNRRVAAPSFG